MSTNISPLKIHVLWDVVPLRIGGWRPDLIWSGLDLLRLNPGSTDGRSVCSWSSRTLTPGGRFLKSFLLSLIKLLSPLFICQLSRFLFTTFRLGSVDKGQRSAMRLGASNALCCHLLSSLVPRPSSWPVGQDGRRPARASCLYTLKIKSTMTFDPSRAHSGNKSRELFIALQKTINDFVFSGGF